MEKQWYAIRTHVGYEQRVKAALQQKVRGAIKKTLVKPERARVRVAVSVFGRPTPVELDFLQVEAA